MSRRCVIHFGMGKTGSTAIQQTLASLPTDRTPMLLLKNQHGRPRTSLLLMGLFKLREKPNRAFRVRGITSEMLSESRDRDWEHLERQFSESSRDVLISAEGIGSFKRQDLERLRDWLVDRVDKITAVGYIRAPGSYMSSAFQQRLKTGAVREWQPQILYPRYRTRFSSFDQVFGSSNVQFWRYDRTTFPGGCVVRDFCKRMGFDLGDARLSSPNQSLSLDAVRLLYVFRQYGGAEVTSEDPAMRSPHGARPFPFEVLRELKGPKLQLAASLVEPLSTTFCEELSWMEDRLGERFAKETDRPDGVIYSEDDLLRPSRASLDWLRSKTHEAEGADGEDDLQEVARRMLSLQNN